MPEVTFQNGGQIMQIDPICGMPVDENTEKYIKVRPSGMSEKKILVEVLVI